MTTLTEEQRLRRVKNALGVTGDYQDDTLEEYINDVMDMLLDAGVRAAVVESDKAVGAISRGVSDLWNLGAGGGALSPVFFQRVIQLAYKPEKEASV